MCHANGFYLNIKWLPCLLIAHPSSHWNQSVRRSIPVSLSAYCWRRQDCFYCHLCCRFQIIFCANSVTRGQNALSINFSLWVQKAKCLKRVFFSDFFFFSFMLSLDLLTSSVQSSFSQWVSAMQEAFCAILAAPKAHSDFYLNCITQIDHSLPPPPAPPPTLCSCCHWCLCVFVVRFDVIFYFFLFHFLRVSFQFIDLLCFLYVFLFPHFFYTPQ